MKTIIIEDQAPARNILQKYINDTEGLSLQKTFCDAIEAQEYLETHPVDLVFLDIHLPRFSGMDLLRSAQAHPLTILTTAYAEFALESFQYNVIDYLLKPFSFERFSRAVDKVANITRSIKEIENKPEVTREHYVYIKSGHDLIKLPIKDIIFIKSDSDYTEVVTHSNSYLSPESLREWNLKSMVDFKQVHKSYIVNMSHLKRISGNKIHLNFDKTLPIGRIYKKPFIHEVKKTMSIRNDE